MSTPDQFDAYTPKPETVWRGVTVDDRPLAETYERLKALLAPLLQSGFVDVLLTPTHIILLDEDGARHDLSRDCGRTVVYRGVPRPDGATDACRAYDVVNASFLRLGYDKVVSLPSVKPTCAHAYQIPPCANTGRTPEEWAAVLVSLGRFVPMGRIRPETNGDVTIGRGPTNRPVENWFLAPASYWVYQETAEGPIGIMADPTFRAAYSASAST